MNDIEIKNLSLKFNQYTIFNKLNLSIKENEKICLVGSSGSGKSTLLHLLCGFHQSFSGEIRIANLLLNESNIDKIRQLVCWVPQANEIPQNNLLVKNYLLQPFSYKYNRNLSFSTQSILKIFSQLQLEELLLQQPFSLLSGGEKQRVLVCQALLLKRDILLIDEPTSGLDRKNSQLMLEVLSNLQNKTIVVATHDSLWKKRFGKCIEVNKVRYKND